MPLPPGVVLKLGVPDLRGVWGGQTMVSSAKRESPPLTPVLTALGTDLVKESV